MQRFAFLFVFISLVFSDLALGIPKILVTGATGFVGNHVVHMLLEQGIFVRVLVRDPEKLEHFEEHIEIVKGDITSLEDVRSAVQGVNAVVHAAAYVSDFALNPHVYTQVNVDGTKNIVDAVLEESKKRTIRLVHLSSVDALEFMSETLVTDDSRYAHRSIYPYPQSKAAAEAWIFAAYQNAVSKGNTRFEVTAIRPTRIFGAGDTRFLQSILGAIQNKLPILMDNPNKTVHLSYIDNLMDTIFLLLTTPEAVGKAFIHDDGAKTWGWIVDTIKAHMEIEKNAWLKSTPYGCGLLLKGKNNTPSYGEKYLFSDVKYSNKLLTKIFSYTPKIPIEEGMKRTLDSLKRLSSPN